MITVRQIERLWDARAYPRLLGVLLAMRPEDSPTLQIQLARPVPVAAMAILRLDELNQSHADIVPRLLRMILAAQDADGGWGDPLTTAVALRALLCSHGQGAAVERAVRYLADLQKTEGIWPRIPFRRMSGDALVSASILYHLADQPLFAQAVRVADAVAWFESHGRELDPDAARLWRSAALYCRRTTPAPAPAAA